VQIEYSTVRVCLDPEDQQVTTVPSYTGQSLVIVQGAKNLEEFLETETTKGLAQLIPVFCVDSFLDGLKKGDQGEVN
jgi:hypothetical protein